MKKIWFAVLFILVSTILAGCQGLFVEPNFLSFDLEVISLDGTIVLNQPIIFLEDDELTVVDLIDLQVGLDYDVYDIGVFVNGVGDFYPTEYGVTYNYYYTLYVNDEVAKVGIQDLVPTDDMKVAFVETTMLDEIDVQVDQLIQEFIDNYLSTYINDTMVSHNVLAALKQLSDYGYDVPSLDNTLLNTLSYTLANDTIANAFKTTVFLKAFDINSLLTETALSAFVATNPYDAVSLLTALTMTSGSNTQINDILASLTSTTPEFMDADYAGMLLLALAQYKDDSIVSQTVDDMVDFIQTMLTVDGIESWGNANSSSTATVILGLVAHGINPRGEAYITDSNDLIEALLSYQIDGAYKWLLTDEQSDMAFSTPQVFASLVAYKIFRDVYGNPAFDLFNF